MHNTIADESMFTFIFYNVRNSLGNSIAFATLFTNSSDESVSSIFTSLSKYWEILDLN
jgi:hypothetical protein